MNELIEVTTYHRMSAKVNPDNPNFAGHFRRPSPPFMEVKAIISNGTKLWRETFKASSMALAEDQIKETIQFFNDTRKDVDNEKERTFVEIFYDAEDAKHYNDDNGMSGWLDPEGVFHPCGFGEHVQYALDLYNKEQERWRSCGTDEIEALMENQHISMSYMAQSTGSFMSILGQLTPPQVEWFNRFFFKLDSGQRSIVARAAKKQGIKLKYDW